MVQWNGFVVKFTKDVMLDNIFYFLYLSQVMEVCCTPTAHDCLSCFLCFTSAIVLNLISSTITSLHLRSCEEVSQQRSATIGAMATGSAAYCSTISYATGHSGSHGFTYVCCPPLATKLASWCLLPQVRGSSLASHACHIAAPIVWNKNYF